MKKTRRLTICLRERLFQNPGDFVEFTKFPTTKKKHAQEPQKRREAVGRPFLSLLGVFFARFFFPPTAPCSTSIYYQLHCDKASLRFPISFLIPRAGVACSWGITSETVDQSKQV